MAQDGNESSSFHSARSRDRSASGTCSVEMRTWRAQDTTVAQRYKKFSQYICGKIITHVRDTGPNQINTHAHERLLCAVICIIDANRRRLVLG